jgi:ribose transport system permease protein
VTLSDTGSLRVGGPDQMEDEPRSRRSGDARTLLARFALPIIFVSIIVFFSVARPDTFATAANWKSIGETQAVQGILAIALIVPLVVGEFDLSVGANLGLAGILVTGLPSKSGVALVPAILIAIAASGIVGVINGVIVGRLGVSSIVATLGTGSVVTGAVAWYSKGYTIFQGIPPGLLDIGKKHVLGIPLPIIYLLVVAVVAWFVLEQTPVGRRLTAVGGSKEASRLSGLKVEQLTFAAFVAAGVLAGVAGVLESALLGTGQPSEGPDLLLPAFSTVFLGATTIRLGVFNVPGTIIALFTIAAATTGLQLMGAPFYITPIFQGVALLIAVICVRLLRKETFG